MVCHVLQRSWFEQVWQNVTHMTQMGLLHFTMRREETMYKSFNYCLTLGRVRSFTMQLTALHFYLVHLRPCGFMVSALVCGPTVWVRAWEHCVVFLGKTLYSHTASLQPGVSMCTGKFNVGGNPAMDWHPIYPGRVEIFFVASCWWATRLVCRLYVIFCLIRPPKNYLKCGSKKEKERCSLRYEYEPWSMERELWNVKSGRRLLVKRHTSS